MCVCMSVRLDMVWHEFLKYFLREICGIKVASENLVTFAVLFRHDIDTHI